MMKYVLLAVFLFICVLLVTDLVLAFIGKRIISAASLRVTSVAAGLFAISLILQLCFAKDTRSVNAFEVFFIMYAIAEWGLYAKQKRGSQRSER